MILFHFLLKEWALDEREHVGCTALPDYIIFRTSWISKMWYNYFFMLLFFISEILLFYSFARKASCLRTGKGWIVWRTIIQPRIQISCVSKATILVVSNPLSTCLHCSSFKLCSQNVVRVDDWRPDHGVCHSPPIRRSLHTVMESPVVKKSYNIEVSLVQ